MWILDISDRKMVLLRMSPICCKALELCSITERTSAVGCDVFSPPLTPPPPPIIDSRSISRSPISSILTPCSVQTQLSVNSVSRPQLRLELST